MGSYSKKRQMQKQLLKENEDTYITRQNVFKRIKR